MTPMDLVALLVTAAVLTLSALPFVLVAWADLRRLERGRVERERLLLRSVQFLPPLRVPSVAAVAAPLMLSRFVLRGLP